METTFTLPLDREEGELVECTITATGSWEGPDRSVGIMSGNVVDVEIAATDDHGAIVKLSATEENRAEEMASNKLYDLFREADADLPQRRRW